MSNIIYFKHSPIDNGIPQVLFINLDEIKEARYTPNEEFANQLPTGEWPENTLELVMSYTADQPRTFTLRGHEAHEAYEKLTGIGAQIGQM